MNATYGKKALLVTIAALAIAGASGAARADDMAGMKMDKKASKPAVESGGAKAKKGIEKLQVAVTDKGFEPDKLEVKAGQPVELGFTPTTDQTCIHGATLSTRPPHLQKPLPP